MLFLTHDELQQLTGYAPNQRKRICKWLSEHGIPYHTNRLGDPAVFRKTVEPGNNGQPEPNFDWIESA